MIKLSLLIPSLESRGDYLMRLRDILSPQLTSEIQLITFLDTGERKIGAKRNWLLNKAKGEYVVFIDDDDRVSTYYIAKVMGGIEKGVDCCSLKGIITVNGENPEIFEHSIKYNTYLTNPHAKYPAVKYERYPNHLNVIKSSIAKQFKFPEKNHGEDTAWATKIFESGLIKTEHYIEDVIYFYDYRSKK